MSRRRVIGVASKPMPAGTRVAQCATPAVFWQEAKMPLFIMVRGQTKFEL